MYIKMNNDKSLVVTVPTTIYQGERNADLITFLIPGYYNGDNLADYAIVMNYVLPSGVRYPEDLVCHPEMYKSYLQYGTKIDTRFTEEAGVVRIWLAALDDNDDVILKTDEVIIAIQESDDVTGYPTPDEVEKLNKLEEKLNKLAEKVVQSDWDQDDAAAIDYIKNKPSTPNAIELAAEMGLVSPVIAEDGSIYTDENGAIYTL